MTGAVLFGGSDALHQLVLVFTNFFQSAAGRVKGGAPVPGQGEYAGCVGDLEKATEKLGA